MGDEFTSETGNTHGCVVPGVPPSKPGEVAVSLTSRPYGGAIFSLDGETLVRPLRRSDA